MGLVSFISRRFNQMRRIPRSLAIMRVIAVTGIAIGSATLLVSLSIVNGFEREYKRAILDFNAHVVVLKAGELSDVREITSETQRLILTPDEKQKAQERSWLAPSWRRLSKLYYWAQDRHDDLAYEIEDRPYLVSLWDYIDPRRLPLIVPQSWRDFARQLSDIEYKSVTGTTPFLYREGLVISRGIIKGIVVKGIDPQTVRDVNQMRLDLAGGKTLEDALPSKSPGIILGWALGRQLGITPGDLSANPSVKLMIPTTEREKKFVSLPVVGFFESGLYDYDSHFALMDIGQTRRIFETPQIAATGVEIKLDDPRKADMVVQRLNEALPATYQALTWMELNRDIFEALALEKLAFAIIMGILVVVAAFNIIGVLILLIYYRIHEIAILKALGIQNNHLQKIFIRGGIATGVTGTALGLIIGWLIATSLTRFNLVRLEPEVYFLSTLPVDLSWSIGAVIFAFSVAMCWLTSRIASKRLVNLPISDALRT